MTTTTVRPAAPVQQADARQALIQGLHELAVLLHEHPDLPVNHPQIDHYVLDDDDTTGLGKLAAIAAALGVAITGNHGGPVEADTTHFHAIRRFGPVAYRAIYITRARMADHHAQTSYRDNIRAEHGQEATV